MLNKLFAPREVLKHNLGYCKLYDTRYNHVLCTKMYFTTDSPARYEFLRSVAHYNILPVYKITQHSIYTKHVVPFATVYDKKHRKYNEYVIAKLREAVDYLHKELRIEHGGIVMDALFVDGYGNVLIGKFDRSAEFRDGRDDEFLLNELSRAMLDRDLSEVGRGAPIFRTLEDRDGFFGLAVEEKKRFVDDVLASRAELLPCVTNTAIRLLLDDVAQSTSEEYKIFVLESLQGLDGELLASFSKSLFSILDSPVRMYLLQQYSGLGNLNECAQEICLGLRVKDKALKAATVDFIFRNEAKFDAKTFALVLRAMQEDVADSDTVGAVCRGLAGLGRDDAHRAVYRLLTHFILLGKTRALVYRCTEQFFPAFDKYKTSTELLPLLCSRLTDQEAQDACFGLVEKILSFLKENRGEIRSREWSFRSLTGMFGGKRAAGTADAEIAAMASKDGWEDEDLH